LQEDEDKDNDRCSVSEMVQWNLLAEAVVISQWLSLGIPSQNYLRIIPSIQLSSLASIIKKSATRNNRDVAKSDVPRLAPLQNRLARKVQRTDITFRILAQLLFAKGKRRSQDSTCIVLTSASS
jgi:hypothetical protein